MSTRRRLMRAGLAGLAIPLLAGCGFRPVYMSSAGDTPGPAARELAAVHIDLIPDRAGQLLRQALQQRMHGTDEDVSAKYDLRVVYWISSEGIAVIPQITTATRNRFIAHANWTLVSSDPAHNTVTSGTATSLGGIDIIDNQYFGADLDTEQVYGEFAQHIADEITLRLASYFRKQAG